MSEKTIVTLQDLINFEHRLMSFLEDNLKKIQKKEDKHFYSPKEFCAVTGLAYSTVIFKCKTGTIKARQDAPKSSWLIPAAEISRFQNEANEDF
jgi:hypothetical protein